VSNIKSYFRQRIFDVFRTSYFFSIFYIRTRTELPLILNRQKLIGIGVEVGVWKGEFSDFLLKNWKGKKLYSVDPWMSFSQEEYPDDMNITQAEFDRIYENVLEQLKVYKERSAIIRKTSFNAAKEFENNFLDFVYLDGRHDYNGVKEDIALWFPKIKKGGMLCGHDYLNGIIGNTDFGVKKAVDEFMQSKQGMKLFITDKDDYPSWFVFKNQ